MSPPLPEQVGLDGPFTVYVTQDFANEPEALHILRRCAYIISSLVNSHGWSVADLEELHPHNGSLGDCLTVTKDGTKVCCKRIRIRLRDQHQPGKLCTIDSAVQIMLHELAHYGGDPGSEGHDLDFYVRNVELLQDLQAAVVNGDVDVEEDEVPLRVTREDALNLVDQVVLAASLDDARALKVMAETSFWPESSTARVYPQLINIRVYVDKRRFGNAGYYKPMKKLTRPLVPLISRA